ncbi:uncharacterized protein STEHIDRAFT_99962 [Stereum hirsutum FP-91666 SS1]|uniref:uncharacterized protein n=1 Tax=Stereum hirsutum (strain FP-91666) TaxID=721885 RepID=UPI00044498A3|nr:uncharacterized protein STEHIDRAFT_99962 [Stereum hirsutum FP-91666 SS1]EIM85009.1 hypothetical protein STEHIDRAFT_99962 [Stereum hirsutum FP-91666 SS1]
MSCRVRSYPTATQDVPWPGWLDIADAEAQHADLPSDEHGSLSSVQRASILDPEERQWVHVQPWLESKGYMSRPRFRPGWRPSWSESATKDDLPKHDDSYPGCSHVMDAFRISDERHVALKRFELPANGRNELEVNTILSSEPLRDDPRNPALPMLEVIHAPNQCFMVFPVGKEIFDFCPATVGEGLDFIEQTLQGLVFLHEKRIAHRDCSIANLLMDPSRMYPHGIHVDDHRLNGRGKCISHVRTRTQVGGVKYYYIDFGESIKFGPLDNTRITIHSKASIFAPETTDDVLLPYDAFKPDIFTLGVTYTQRIAKVLVSWRSLSVSLMNLASLTPLSTHFFLSSMQ